MPEHNPGQMGGTMRLGKRRTLFQTKNSIMSKACFIFQVWKCFLGIRCLYSGYREVRSGNVKAFLELTSISEMEINQFGPL